MLDQATTPITQEMGLCPKTLGRFKVNFNIRPYSDTDRPSLERLLRDYLSLTAEELAKAPWHFELPINGVMSMTFDKLEMFTPPNGQILIAKLMAKHMEQRALR